MNNEPASCAPERAMDRDFRLMFLRSDDLDPHKAARRLCNYFDVKLDLFGLDNLLGPITWEDLDEGTREIILTGRITILPFKDPAGRPIAIRVQAPIDEDFFNVVRRGEGEDGSVDILNVRFTNSICITLY
jgi:hypothetical protein